MRYMKIMPRMKAAVMTTAMSRHMPLIFCSYDTAQPHSIVFDALLQQLVLRGVVA